MSTRVKVRGYPMCALGHAITAEPLEGGIGGRVVLRLSNQNYGNQDWKKIEITFNNSPCFALISCTTEQVIQYAGPGTDLRLTPYNGQANDETILWKSVSLPTDQAGESCIIEPAGDNTCCWTVKKNNSDSYDGICVRCDKIEQSAKGNFLWRFPPINVRVHPMCAIGSAITAEQLMGGRGHRVILRPYNQNDENQLLKVWERRETTLNNSSCFALINRATRQVIQSAGPDEDLQLVPYNDQSNADMRIWWKEKPTPTDQADVFRIVEPAHNLENICWKVNRDNNNSYDEASVRCERPANELDAKDNQLWSFQRHFDPW